MSTDRMLKRLQRRAWVRGVVDFVAIYSALLAGYAATGSALVGAGVGLAVAAYGCWCFKDGASDV